MSCLIELAGPRLRQEQLARIYTRLATHSTTDFSGFLLGIFLDFPVSKSPKATCITIYD